MIWRHTEEKFSDSWDRTAPEKATTIKMIMSLLQRDEGEIYINGYSIDKNFEKAMAKVGGIVENPETYTHLTGLENLQQYARMRDGVTRERIDEVVRMVGLENRIHDKVKKYSLGMKQRLGVAQSIMHHPDLLVLDEPTNGLDPAWNQGTAGYFKASGS